MRQILAALGVWLCLCAPATAQEGGDAAPAVAAFAAAEAGDWQTAYALMEDQDDIGDDLGRDLITWLRLRAGDAVFAEYPAFLAARADWPGLDAAREAAEGLIDDTVPTDRVLAFFEGRRTETGSGALAYAKALAEAGRAEEAEAMLIDLWTTQGLSEEGFAALFADYPEVLAPHHAERADRMLWRWRAEDTTRLLPLLTDEARALAHARIGYIEGAEDLPDRLEAVPEDMRDDPALAYDRFNWLAGRGDWTDAVALLRARSVSAEALVHPWRWASWRRILARWQMREGEPRVAYELASKHFLDDGASFADLEWLSGYLALTYLDDPALALRHFETFAAAVSTPISTGRAGYWLGRAHEALGDSEAARAAFSRAAQHQTTFYGLLASERLGQPLDAALAGGEGFADWRDASFVTDDRFRAAMLLLSGEERGLAVLFLADLARDLDRQEVGQMGDLLMELDEPFFTVMVAKSALRRDLLVQDHHFPVHPLAEMHLPVEPALALSIARQESEFRTDAGSAVGALGLMQLMPGTAQDMARALDLPYSRARLVVDWPYNARLGAAYLDYLRGEFGDSPVLIAVGYNAGPGRARSWISERGDPRRGDMDVVDWIEHIPFRETRNYVMRVTEGIPVYRARLTGETGPVAFRDLLRGAAPVIRPRLRPEALGLPDLRPRLRPSNLSGAATGAQ
ncbi:transglycosylase SLT domain-containing protein [Roseovarius sp. SYSU LYC5161]|jgi:soluble lytic murein transglycosylase|uniref:lytic transglycosylase domain-containing protein n=1 Tax=Roseovarius halophilus (ex Wu et al. 2025) TaxID=3376060 RepID=UPI00399B02B7